jgi:hypothetical protein
MRFIFSFSFLLSAVVAFSQQDWGFDDLIDDAASTRPAWVIYEPVDAGYIDAVASALYGGWSFFDTWEESWIPWLGLFQSGCFCSGDMGEDWANAGQWMELVFGGQLPIPTPIEVEISQHGQDLYQIQEFEVLGDFAESFGDVEGWIIVPEASVGYQGNWRLEFFTLNCFHVLCCDCDGSNCGPTGHERSFYVGPESWIPEGWYLLFKLPSSFASSSSPLPDYWSANGWSCVGCEGCTNPEACNYFAFSSSDEALCNFLNCRKGCTQPGACNYDAAALYDDDSCTFPSPGYACDGTAASGFCGEGTEWNADLQQCVGTTQIAGNCDGDWDGDGTRGVSDLLSFLSVFGEDCDLSE